MTRFFIALAVSFLVSYTSSGYAQTAPVPEQKQINLEQKFAEVERELSKTKERLVKISRSVQDNERTLQELEGKIQSLEAERAALRLELKEDQKSISRLILALQRIKRVPPEALIAKPDAPLKTAQSAMLMSDIIPSLNRQAEQLKANLQRLDVISDSLEVKRANVVKTSEQLKKEQVKLSNLVERRQKLYISTAKDLEAQQKRTQLISRQAKTLKDLVKGLDKDLERVQSANLKPSEQSKKSSKTIRTVRSMPSSGRPQLPLSGVLKLGYNEKDAFGAPSKGVEIEGRGGALIVVPMGGIVRFAGHFKNYGNMIIIEHKKGYHSLIAGFEKIDTVVGQVVSVGEPLGKLHYASSTSKPTLYYELRHKGEPIDPAKKFEALG